MALFAILYVFKSLELSAWTWVISHHGLISPLLFFSLLSVAVAKNRLHTFIRRAMNINKKWAPGSKRWKEIDILKEDARRFDSSSFDSSFAPFTSVLLELACVSWLWNRGSSPSFYAILLSSISLFFFSLSVRSCKGDSNTGVFGSLCCCFCLFFFMHFPHGQNYKCNSCASSLRVHAPLSSRLDEMTGFRDKRQPLLPRHPSLSCFQHSCVTDACWSGLG